MLQQVMTNPGEIIFREVEIPAPQPGQVLIRMMRLGICGSDIHVYHGKHPFTSYPITQGHEVSGVIEAVGSGVENFSVGQKVTVQPQVVCGKCHPCRHGKYNLCEELKVMGFQTTGMASEYFAVDAEKVLALPESISYDEGAMLEPLAVAVHAVRRFGDVEGMDVAVLGAGPIGNLVAQAAKSMGARRVLVTDVSDYRLNLAKECGADDTVNTRNIDFGDAMVEIFGRDKVDVIYDCAANDITMGQAIKYARKGSTIILVGVYADIAKVDLAVLNDHELDLNTTMMYRQEDFEKAICLLEESKIKLQPLMSKHFAFQDFLAAYQYIDANRETTMKVLVDIAQG